MATRNKRKLAASNKENCEEHPRTNLAKNSNVPRSQEDSITQVFEENEGRVTKKLSQEVSRTENRILGALAHIDDFLTNPLIRGHSGTGPETSQNIFSINQGTNEDDSQSNPHPKAGLSTNQMAQNSGPEDGHDSLITSWISSINASINNFSPVNVYSKLKSQVLVVALTMRLVETPKGAPTFSVSPFSNSVLSSVVGCISFIGILIDSVYLVKRLGALKSCFFR